MLHSMRSPGVRHDLTTEQQHHPCGLFRGTGSVPGFPGGSVGKESTCDGGDWVRPVGWEDPLEEDMATHCSLLAWRIPMDGGTWRATVHGITQSQI